MTKSIFANTGNFKKLIVYQKAEAIYDITFFLPQVSKKRR